MFWQIVLFLVIWIVCSLLFGAVWALGHRQRHAHRCRACTAPRELGPLMRSAALRRGSYTMPEVNVPDGWVPPPGHGQKSAPIPAPPPMRVMAPTPKAPKK